jgi:hypothetical protein
MIRTLMESRFGSWSAWKTIVIPYDKTCVDDVIKGCTDFERWGAQLDILFEMKQPNFDVVYFLKGSLKQF